jgi:hypothetical protein
MSLDHVTATSAPPPRDAPRSRPGSADADGDGIEAGVEVVVPA